MYTALIHSLCLYFNTVVHDVILCFVSLQALLEGLKELDWPEKVKTMQEHWIGKSEGSYFDFPIDIDTQVKSPRMRNC